MNRFWLDFFSFRKMVSFTIIKFLYVIVFVVITLIGLRELFRSPAYGIGLLIFGNLFWRVFCESLILIFSIQQELIKINQKQ